MNSSNWRMAEQVARLQDEADRQHDEIAELRSRLFQIQERLTAYGQPDNESIVRERLLELVCDAIVEDHELELDEGKVRHSTSRRSACTAERLRAKAASRGLSLGELDAEMGWPEGRTERVLAALAKSPHEDVRRLSERLGIPMTRVFEPRASDGETVRMFDDDSFDRQFQETRQILSAAQHKFWTTFRWTGGSVAVLVLAALFVAWKIWGS